MFGKSIRCFLGLLYTHSENEAGKPHEIGLFQPLNAHYCVAIRGNCVHRKDTNNICGALAKRMYIEYNISASYVMRKERYVWLKKI